MQAYTSVCAFFDAKEKVVTTMKRAYFLDTLFDLINESDVLETELLDINLEKCGLRITMKDGSVFYVAVDEIIAEAPAAH